MSRILSRPTIRNSLIAFILAELCVASIFAPRARALTNRTICLLYLFQESIGLPRDYNFHAEYPSRAAAFNAAKRDSGIAQGSSPFKIRWENLTTRQGHAVLGPNGKPLRVREYLFHRIDGQVVVIQDHFWGHHFDSDLEGEQGPHFNVRSEGKTRNGHVSGTRGHYGYEVH